MKSKGPRGRAPNEKPTYRPGERRLPKRHEGASRPTREARFLPPKNPEGPRPGAKVRNVVLSLWTKIRMDWGFAATRLSSALRQERSLNSHERREVVETLFGMIRHARKVDFALEASGQRLPPDSRRELARYVTYKLLEGEMALHEAALFLPDLDWPAVLAVDERIGKERDPVRRLALQRSYPDWIAERFLNEYGDEADAFLDALNQRAPLTLRANTLKITRDALLARLQKDGIACTPTLYTPHGIKLKERVDVWSLAAFKEGLFEAQDEGSQLIAELVAPPPKGFVADVCAGAGGKTLALGAMMQSKGRLLAVDIEAHKLEDLKKRVRRAGISSVQAFPTETHAWPHDLAMHASKIDRVLVDAPCSGIGSLRRNPEIRWRLTPEDVDAFTQEQESIAARAMELVAPGGRLIYATCTVLRAENEAVIERLLQKHSNLEIMRAAEIWGNAFAAPICDPTGTYLKTTPHKNGSDGFFAAVLRKKA